MYIYSAEINRVNIFCIYIQFFIIVLCVTSIRMCLFSGVYLYSRSVMYLKRPRTI